MSLAPVLSARDLCKTYTRGSEKVRAVDRATLTVSEGELIAVAGPSGSGKTTLLNLIAGWEQPDAGEALLLGSPASDERTWAEIAVVPQTLGLLEELTIEENVALPLFLGRHGAGSGRLDVLLDELGLSALRGRRPEEVSLGEQQRTALARALVCDPRLVLADEPTGHQDAVWARGVFRALEHARKGGTACLVATHNEEVLRHFDRVVHVQDGRIVDGASGSISDERM